MQGNLFTGLSQSSSGHQQEAPKGDDEDHNHILKRFCHALCALHHHMLEILQTPPCSSDNVAISAIQHEAALVLVLGLDLFYPSQVQQCQLISEVVGSASGLESPVSSHCGQSMISTERLEAKEILLKPLLERFLDDRMARSLLPVLPRSVIRIFSFVV